MSKLISKISLLFMLLILLSFQSSISLEPKIQDQSLQMQQAIRAGEVSKSQRINLNYGRMPLHFIHNQGQVNEEALFYAKTIKYTLWVTREELVFDTIRREGGESGIDHRRIERKPENYMFEREVSRLVFMGANKNPEVVPVDVTELRVNYLKGRDQSEWKTDIPTSKAVLYRELYKNIDLKVYGVEDEVEYDWVVKPGGNISDIRFEYQDVLKTKIEKNSDLIIKTQFGELKHARPVCYQLVGGKRVEVEAEFKRVGKNTYNFRVGDYNRDNDLVIDPKIFYSSYLGGAEVTDRLRDIVVDSKGAAYMTGETSSTDFPTKKAYQKKIKGKIDAVVCKVKPKGKKLVYCTFLGGSDFEYAHSIAVDKNGAVYVTGETYSENDFPLKNAIQGVFGGAWEDAFVTKLSPSGKVLVYSTYLGGDSHDKGWSIAVDSTGAAYVGGETSSFNFPVKNAVQPIHAGSGGRDAFVTKINPAGSAILYSTYLGGSGNDDCYGLAIDSNKAVYFTGDTWSSDFPTKSLYNNYFGNGDAYIAKISPAGTQLIYSTYLGGSKEDIARAIAVDSTGAAYVTGETDSLNFPLKKAFQKKYGGGQYVDDAFVTKINPTGTALVYSTYLGGISFEYGRAIDVDSKGNAYVAGSTRSNDFPLKKSLKPRSGSFESDMFIGKFKKSGKKFYYLTLLGGDSDEYVRGIYVDSTGEVYVAGWSYSYNYPTKKAVQGKPSKNNDAVFTKLK